MKINLKKVVLSYLFMSLVIAIGGYIFGITITLSLKIGLFSGLYVFLEEFIRGYKKSN
jgi:hypothetical protein